MGEGACFDGVMALRVTALAGARVKVEVSLAGAPEAPPVPFAAMELTQKEWVAFQEEARAHCARHRLELRIAQVG